MLKIATVEDLDDVMAMSLEFINSTHYNGFAEEDKIKSLALAFLNGDKEERLILLYMDDDKPIGMLAGTVTSFIYGSAKLATEVAWWVEPNKRGVAAGKALITAFEFWAKKVGCRAITMMCLDDKVGKFYEKNGYRLYERSYLKELK